MIDELSLKKAVSAFETLLRGQTERAEKMKENAEPIDFSKIQKTVVGIIGGDGIGPLIVSSAEKVLRKLLFDEIARGSVELKNIEGLTIENRLNKGESVPEEVLCEIKKCHVLLKGPTTTPKGGTGAKELESANVTLRRELDLFSNVRPVCVPEKGIDWTFFRENTEGEYVLGSRGVEAGELCCDFKVTTVEGTKRIARAAYEFARKNGKKRVTVVTKANIMKKTDGMFARICREVGEDYPEIETEDRYVDIMAAEMISEKTQSHFEVILAPNLYGDILTDEAAQIQGGVGTAGSANTGAKYAMFEAIHGSAPRMIEEGLGDYANPESILEATKMLLCHIGRNEKAKKLADAMKKCGEDPKNKVTGDRNGITCIEYTEKLLKLL